MPATFSAVPLMPPSSENVYKCVCVCLCACVNVLMSLSIYSYIYKCGCVCMCVELSVWSVRVCPCVVRVLYVQYLCTYICTPCTVCTYIYCLKSPEWLGRSDMI